MTEPLPIVLPPGFFGNGTPYSAAGRYATGDLVRFVNGFARPVGGWQRRIGADGQPLPPIFTDPSIEAARSAIAWKDNGGSGHTVVGTNLGLYEVSPSGVFTDITPAGFTGGEKDSQYIVGYGTQRYNQEAYGTRRTGAGAPLGQVANWSFSLFGEILLAQFRSNGPLYQWTPGTPTALPVTNAPTGAQAVLVTSERIAMTVKRQPRLVEWSASEDYDTWTPQITNTAGSQVLAGAGDLQAITQVGREILVFSDEDLWVGRYVGAPFIYGFEAVGKQCGVLAPNSIAVAGGRAYWFGRGGLWTYDGTVRKLDTDVEDWLRVRIAPEAISKMYAVELPAYREIWWFFQSVDGDECDSYVAFNYVENHWVFGSLDRTTGVPPGVSESPLLIGVDGVLYNHDLAGVKVPLPRVAYLETGPLELGSGGRQMGVQFLYHDLVPQDVMPIEGTKVGLVKAPKPAPVEVDNAAQVLILGKDWPSPNEPERAYGPYPLDRPSPTTGARGREIRLRYIGETAYWRVGRPRMKVVAMGER